MFRTLRAALLGAALPIAAAADPVALLIANVDYENGRDAPEAARIDRVADAARRGGLHVVAGTDVTRAETRALLDEFARAATEAADGDAALVVLAGRFTHLGRESQLLYRHGPARPGVGDLLDDGLSTSVVVGLLAELEEAGLRPILVLAQPEEQRIVGDRPFVRPGLGAVPDLGIPFVAGPMGPALEQAADIARAGGRLDRTAARRRGLQVMGFDDASRPAPPAPGRGSAGTAERDYWTTVERFDSRTAYAAYLNRYPDGAFAAVARQRLSAIAADPARDARLAEEGLDLDREARRAVQSDLALLGYDTRGVDGIFGPGTRGAVRAWQRANGTTETGFLDAAQIQRLDAQASRRQVELDAEAERRQARIAASDRAFWEETGRGATQRGVLQYLERYPDGIHADTAELRLSAFEAEARAAAQSRDARAWDAAAAADTAEAYRLYLQEEPNGQFRTQAQAALERLAGRGERREERQRLLAQESALGLSPDWRRLVEVGLRQQGFDPGAVDGEFDRGTRRALRRYQESRGLERTGFLNQETVVRMLSESVLR